MLTIVAEQTGLLPDVLVQVRRAQCQSRLHSRQRYARWCFWRRNCLRYRPYERRKRTICLALAFHHRRRAILRLVTLCSLLPTGLPGGTPQRKTARNCLGSSQSRRQQKTPPQHDVEGRQNDSHGLATLRSLPHLLWCLGSLQLVVVVHPIHYCRSRIQRSPGSVDECSALCSRLWLVCLLVRKIGRHR